MFGFTKGSNYELRVVSFGSVYFLTQWTQKKAQKAQNKKPCVLCVNSLRTLRLKQPLTHNS